MASHTCEHDVWIGYKCRQCGGRAQPRPTLAPPPSPPTPPQADLKDAVEQAIVDTFQHMPLRGDLIIHRTFAQKVVELLASRQALSTRPPGGAWRPDREAVARIIDPKLFHTLDNQAGFPPESLERYQQASLNEAFAKADAILALPAAPSPKETA